MLDELEQLLIQDTAPTAEIERALVQGLRARPVETWCAGCHRMLKYLLARVRTRKGV